MKNIEKRIDKMINEMSDEDNPKYMYQGMSVKLLSKLLKVNSNHKGKDLIYWAKSEMVSRGLDAKGKWIGFDDAEKFWKL